MQRLTDIFKNFTLFILFLTTFLFAYSDRIVLPVWLQVAGRMHPLLLHLPIGIIVLTSLLVLVRSQFEPEQFKKLITYSLLLTALTASITVFFGFLLSVGGDYSVNTLQQHKVGGLIIGWLSYLALVFYQSPFQVNALKHGAIALLFALLLFVGHTGAVLTHGENFVFAPLNVAEAVIDIDNDPLYTLAILPVLEKKCITCHNESKSKGKLIMSVIDKFKQGGKSGLAFIAGNPDSSRMLQYIHLPLEHEDHMPPDGKAQLTEFEVSLLEAWIKSGADFTKKLIEFSVSDTLVSLANRAIDSKSHLAETSEYNFDAVSVSMLEKLNTPFRSVLPLHLKSSALQANFFIEEYFNVEALEELNQINEQLIVLNLSKMPIVDEDLKLLSGFENLESLNLNYTDLTGAGLSNLKSCKNLKSISLAGTKVTKESLLPLLSSLNLNSVYIWNTNVTEAQKKELEKTYPTINFLFTQYKDESMVALSMPNVMHEGILRKQDSIKLNHTMPGVTIRYTVDGTQPDSINGKIYEQPIHSLETLELKAIACKEGWYCSPLFESSVYKEGVRPAQVKLLTLPHVKYPGSGAVSLTDGIKGFIEEFKSPDWLGYTDTNFEAHFDYGKNPPALDKIIISYGVNINSSIFPPIEIQVWGGDKQNSLQLLVTQKLEEPKAYTPSTVNFVAASWKKSTYDSYKVVVKPNGRLPQWHGGKGQKGWLFVDEILFY